MAGDVDTARVQLPNLVRHHEDRGIILAEDLSGTGFLDLFAFALEPVGTRDLTAACNLTGNMAAHDRQDVYGCSNSSCHFQ